MKLTALFLFVISLHISASTSSQSVTLVGKNLTLERIFAAVKQQTGYTALFDGEDIRNALPVTINARSLPLDSFLKEVFKNQPLRFTINNTSIFINRKVKDSVEELVELLDSIPRVRIIGRVVGNDGQVLSGATVRVKRKNRAVPTNSEGVFEILTEPGSVLQFSYAGYGTVEEKATVNRMMLIKLEANAVLEEAVVYNGYQKIQQKYLTGSVTSLRMDSVMQPGLSTVDKMLEGRVPGLTYMQNSGQAGAAPKLRVRGTNTYLGSREPLWVVDGIIRTNPIPIDPQRLNDPDFVNLLGNAVSGLNPFDIEQIDVLKDATAAALYGVRAANGVIVITTKRGKAGPPTVNYNVTSSFTQRPRYTDRAINMMNSKDRVDVSREMIEKNYVMRGTVLEAYEKAYIDYHVNNIDYESFQKAVDQAESINTDWLGHIMRDVFANNHTLSVSGGSSTLAYRASVGARKEPGVIKKEANSLYTGLLNMQMKYRKVLLDFDIQLKKENRRYTPAEIGVINYAYSTSRAIPLYNPDQSLYFYPTFSSSEFSDLYLQKDIRTMNILNEMDNSGELIESNEYIASVNFNYEIVPGLQFRSRLAYTGGVAHQSTWFNENTDWAMQIRKPAYIPGINEFVSNLDLLPFGGELRLNTSRKANYLINSRLNYSQFIDHRKRHQLNAEVAFDVLSNRTSGVYSKQRGYYRDRGQSFAQIDLLKHTAYQQWVASNLPVISEGLQKSIRPFFTATYVFNDRYVLNASASQEFSNSFGNRSNERFLPTWAFSGRWNLHEDLFRNVGWIDNMAMLLSFGLRGNMIDGQSPYTVIKKGAFDPYQQEFISSISRFPNPELAWEKVQDYSANIVFNLLKGRINGSLGYFKTKTRDAFLQKRLSVVNGITGNQYIVNGGTLENEGVEIALNFKIIDQASKGNKKGLMWRFDPQFGQVINRLINSKLNSRNVLVDAASVNYSDFLNGSAPINGKSVNTFYSYRFKTLDPHFGYPVFYGAEPENKVALRADYNSMVKEDVYRAVLTESGRREPVIQGSISNSFLLANWTLNVTMSYSLGNKIRLLQAASGNYGTFRPTSQQNLRGEFVDRWRYPGDEKFTNIPAIQGIVPPDQYDLYAWFLQPSYTITHRFAENYFQMYDFSDLRVVKGDYLKMQFVSLSYRFNEGFCKKMKVKGAFASISGSNLFTLADKALKGQDPTQSGTAPNINLSIRPVYSVNINVSF